ncbi:MAG: septal ring lytic transglycosylase RlpA family protein [Halioglobus sp.]|nr:septal ring lytic transglycosylase RlpA family protein [Halioglobus sp.]
MGLAACSTLPPEPAPEPGTTGKPTSRYAHSRDFAPLKTISASEVRDAIPRPDPILSVGNMSPYSVNGVTYTVLPNHSGYRERGIASWYGAKFDGHATSNGEIYDLYQASAAHKTLPIPSYATVTNLDNGRTVVVRINDRGPFHPDRLIDLSYAAAVKLGFADTGTANVEVEVIDIAGVDDRRDTLDGHYRFLQMGAFGSEATALRLQDELQPLLPAPVVVSQVETGGGLLFRVRVGPVDDPSHLQHMQRLLRNSGYEAGQPLP